VLVAQVKRLCVPVAPHKVVGVVGSESIIGRHHITRKTVGVQILLDLVDVIDSAEYVLLHVWEKGADVLVVAFGLLLGYLAGVGIEVLILLGTGAYGKYSKRTRQ
jgi:hypothetical protein